ncbi:MAG: tripartite tricarboxylate transporter TctB family protein [Ostreibacterium sp.]
MRKLNTNHWIALVILTLCMIAIALALRFDELPPLLKRGLQPRAFPIGICVVIGLLTIIMCLFDNINQSIVFSLDRNTLMTLLILFIFILLLQVDLLIAMSISMTLISFLWGKPSIKTLIGLGLVFPAIIFYLFSEILSVRFPHGMLTNLFLG